jgi:hypothetical protein
MCHREEGLYIRKLQKPSGSNLLDEPLKGFIVLPCLLTLEVFLGVTILGIWVITTHSESVHMCAEFNKLVY